MGRRRERKSTWGIIGENGANRSFSTEDSLVRLRKIETGKHKIDCKIFFIMMEHDV